MQLDQVTLQVLLLHELLGAGGALENRPKVTSLATHTKGTLTAPRLWGQEPNSRAKPKMPGGSVSWGKECSREGRQCHAHRDAEPALHLRKEGPRKGQCPSPKVGDTRWVGKAEHLDS